MAQVYDFAQMDSKGRVFIPSKVRGLLNIREGMRFMVIADSTRYEIRLVPIANEKALLFKITLRMVDVVGSLSKVLDVVAREGVDLLLTQSRTIKRGELAEWVAIVDFSNVKSSVEETVQRLRELDVVKEVMLEKL